MNEITVIMPTYNVASTIKNAIESVLKQTCEDFEFLIIDYGSTDDTISCIQSFNDSRIHLFKIKSNNLSTALNWGLIHAIGKYIIPMNPDHIMHIDCLKIQYIIMEEEPSITVCGTWMTAFGSGLSGQPLLSLSGLIESPLLKLMHKNIIFDATIMIRKEFLYNHNLQYENYPYFENYKLCSEIAKRKGTFYIDSQSLLYYRVSEKQENNVKQKEKQQETIRKIRLEILNYLINLNKLHHSEILISYKNLLQLKDKGIIDPDIILDFFYSLFFKNRNRLEEYIIYK